MRLRDRYRRLSLWNKLAAWGAAASIAGLLLATIALLTTHSRISEPSTADGRPLIEQVDRYLRELDEIEQAWPSRNRELEPLASRAATILEGTFPLSSAAIRDSITATEARHLARQLRYELTEVHDVLLVRHHSEAAAHPRP